MTTTAFSDSVPYQSPLLERAGAAEAQTTGSAIDAAGVAWHYGNPLGEQRKAHQSTVVVDRSHRRVIKVDGPDAGPFLHNLLSQKLDEVPSGFSAAALDLDIQGHILHHIDLSRLGTAFYLDLPADQAPSFLDFLQRMIFWSQVEIAEVDLAVLTILGNSIEIPDDLAPVVVRTVDWTTLPRLDVLIERTELISAVDKLLKAGVELAGLMAFTAERVRAMEPEKSADLDSKSIPHEVPAWIGRGDHPGAVHLEKGCYRGQETVARVENLGRSPRVLVMFQVDGSAPEDPTPGSVITAGIGGRSVGRLGTVVHDCDFGPIALGLLKRSALTADNLSVDEIAIMVDPTAIPHEDESKAGREAINRFRGK
ncbi:YgfZ/GcvT domain-containing protein [Corynebacterium alimapuense]|uniref:Folate-binding protein YgfZ n=1 Tax=Corynebacterium alimapuense TaxID=1576874 RepID=A0A3M8KAD9_9CORY|nr:folate-binding protein YgfZ [Corynebacterium alimapuense]RNE49829.1 folate-binding protein YgfZ [Corynebacterium alimapuense]